GRASIGFACRVCQAFKLPSPTNNCGRLVGCWLVPTSCQPPCSRPSLHRHRLVIHPSSVTDRALWPQTKRYSPCPLCLSNLRSTQSVSGTSVLGLFRDRGRRGTDVRENRGTRRRYMCYSGARLSCFAGPRCLFA